MDSKIKYSLSGVAGFVIVALGFGSFFTVDQGDTSVVLRFGQIERTASSGLNFKLPFVESTAEISNRTQVTNFKLSAYTSDNQPATINMSVNWHVAPSNTKQVYAEFKDLELAEQKIIHTSAPQFAKNVFGHYTAISAIRDRDRLVADITEEMHKINPVISIETVQISDVSYSDAYDQAVEQRMQAEVEVQKRKQELETEKINAQMTVVQATAKRDAAVAEAEGSAKAKQLAGEAEAKALQAKADVLNKNPQLIELVKAEAWNGQLPTTMLSGNTGTLVNLK